MRKTFGKVLGAAVHTDYSQAKQWTSIFNLVKQLDTSKQKTTIYCYRSTAGCEILEPVLLRCSVSRRETATGKPTH